MIGVRKKPRTATEVEADIRTAVLAELAEGGYAAVTFEGIARRVGTSKPVLYRRFPDRASMIFDAIRSRPSTGRLETSTGSLRGDLLVMMRRAQDKTTRYGAEAYRALIGDARSDTLAQAAAMAVDALPRIERIVLTPARERGELGPLPLSPDVVLTPMRLGRDRIIFGRFSDDEVVAIVDDVAIPLYRAVSGLPPQVMPTA
ncbi:MAG: TetR/AcrR family transcriptional regulator [Micropruina sp.]|uniref:TetR/AcrR family transcriptional regulator n=1 Tax=Micropruina sp. TaxID=2737536 RepID=UPI0039E4A008